MAHTKKLLLLHLLATAPARLLCWGCWWCLEHGRHDSTGRRARRTTLHNSGRYNNSCTIRLTTGLSLHRRSVDHHLLCLNGRSLLGATEVSKAHKWLKLGEGGHVGHGRIHGIKGGFALQDGAVRIRECTQQRQHGQPLGQNLRGNGGGGGGGEWWCWWCWWCRWRWTEHQQRSPTRLPQPPPPQPNPPSPTQQDTRVHGCKSTLVVLMAASFGATPLVRAFTVSSSSPTTVCMPACTNKKRGSSMSASW